MDKLNEVFHALADPTRREMLQLLSSSERTVTELASPFSISLQSASKHIKVLERAGLISRTINGRTHTCRLQPPALDAAREWLKFYERYWNSHFDALELELMKLESENSGGGEH